MKENEIRAKYNAYIKNNLNSGNEDSKPVSTKIYDNHFKSEKKYETIKKNNMFIEYRDPDRDNERVVTPVPIQTVDPEVAGLNAQVALRTIQLTALNEQLISITNMCEQVEFRIRAEMERLKQLEAEEFALKDVRVEKPISKRKIRTE